MLLTYPRKIFDCRFDGLNWMTGFTIICSEDDKPVSEPNWKEDFSNQKTENTAGVSIVSCELHSQNSRCLDCTNRSMIRDIGCQNIHYNTEVIIGTQLQ